MDSIGWIVPRTDFEIEVSLAWARPQCKTKDERCADVGDDEWPPTVVPFNILGTPEFCRDPHQFVTPIVWQGNHRSAEDFKSASFLATDFDTPIACMDEVWQQVTSNDLHAVLYTTQNHQKPKSGRNGKTLPPCDRYRIFAAMDRPITDPDEYDLFYACVLLSPIFRHADTACADRARIYCVGDENSEVRYHPGMNVISVDGMIRTFGAEAKTRQRAARARGYGEAAEMARALEFGEHPCSADGNIIRRMSDYYESTEWQTPNTCERIYGTIAYALRSLRPDPYLIAACAEQWWVYQDWLSRHPDRAGDLPVLVTTALLEVAGSGLVRDRIVPPNPVVEFNWPVELPGDVRDSVLKLCKARGMAAKTSEVDGLFYHCMTSPDTVRSIVSAPCGQGKTSSAIAYAACRATRERPVWIIPGTRKAAKGIRAEMRTVYGLEPGFLTGYDPDACVQPVPPCRQRLMYDKRRTPCHRCAKSGDCDFYRSYFSEADRTRQLATSVVLMTHHMLMRLLALGQVPATAVLVIDEEPRRWERLSLKSTELDLLDGRLAQWLEPGDADHVDERAGWHEFRQCLDAARDRARESGDGIWADVSMPPELLTALFKRLHQVEGMGSAPTHRGKAENAASYDWAYAFLRFFGYPARKAVFYTPQNATWHCSTDTIALTLPNRLVILNASAMFSAVTWEGATVYRIPDRRTYSGTHVHVLTGNPTKAFMKRKLKDFMAKAEDVLKSVASPVVFVAVDKTSTEEDAQHQWLHGLEATCGPLLLGTRGSITGSNDYGTATATLILMATFRDVPDYVLTTMHVTQEELSSNRIWTAMGKPLMHNGFTDQVLQRQLLRASVDEVYQTLMRGIIRSQPSADYHVVVTLTPEAAQELAALLPGASFHADNTTEFMVALRQRDTDELTSMSISDMEAAIGAVSRDKANLSTLRNARNVVAIERLLNCVPLLYSSYKNRYTLCPSSSPSLSSLKQSRGNPHNKRVGRWHPGAPGTGAGYLPCRVTVLARTAA
jgi:hypothetical protein